MTIQAESPTATAPVDETELYDRFEDAVRTMLDRDGIEPVDPVGAAHLLRTITERSDRMAPTEGYTPNLRRRWNRVLFAERSARLADWLAIDLEGRTLDVLAGDGSVASALQRLGVCDLDLTERLEHYPPGSWDHIDGEIIDFGPGAMDGEHDTLLVVAVLHHEIDPIAFLDQMAQSNAKRWVVVENCIDDTFDGSLHLLVDHFFNQVLNEFGLTCSPQHRDATAWREMLGDYGTVVHEETLQVVPGIPFTYTKYVVER